VAWNEKFTIDPTRRYDHLHFIYNIFYFIIIT